MKKELAINRKTSPRTTRGKVIKFSAFILSLLIAHCSLLFVLSCDQPFKAGLGPIVDLRNPTITLISPKTGTYIRGVQKFEGTADDDNKLDSVWFQLANYPDIKELYGLKSMEHKELGLFFQMPATDIVITKNGREWAWSFEIDTMQLENGVRVFPDGDLLIRLLARDIVGKENVNSSMQYAFNVKNDIPLISVSNPSIVQGVVDGDLSSDHLNYDFIFNVAEQRKPFKRVMDTKSWMTGLISDNQGIYRGPEMDLLGDDGAYVLNKDGNRIRLFPPQIRFWQVKFSDNVEPGKDNYPIFNAGYVPTETEVEWKNLDITELNDKSFMFILTLPEESGTYYGFQIRAQSSDEVHSPAYYPGDWYNFTGKTEEYINENSHVLLLVREPTEYPELVLYNLEDIYGPPQVDPQDNVTKPVRAPNGGPMMYYRLPEIDDQMAFDGNHPYVNRAITNKGGAFTLRMKASHSGGVASVKVYWEKDDRSIRGRFIWDPADALLPSQGWVGQTPPWRGGSVGVDKPYETWGRNEPDGGYQVRSYVFTYTDKPDQDRIPDDPKYNKFVKGKSKVQVYVGPNPHPDTSPGVLPTTSALFDALENAAVDNEAYWQDIDTLPDDGNPLNQLNGKMLLPEGTYDLSVYARSVSGTRIGAPFTAQISIDRGKPDLELNYIEGSAGETLNDHDERENLVNGVIQPRFLLSDSRPVDTGFRTGTRNYFKRPPDPSNPAAVSYYSEQAYILIKEADRAKMDAYLGSKPNLWPAFNDSLGDLPVKPEIPDVEVWKHGPIVGSVCRFKTSKIYHLPTPPEETDSLEDGMYRLYAFARDNAFNVASVSYPIEVKLVSDYPTLDFGVFPNTGVTEPDSAYDFGGTLYGDGNPEKSFIVRDSKASPRNKFNANSIIQIKLRDDDSLDLGQDAATLKDSANNPVTVANEPSGITVTFIGSKPNDQGIIEALGPDSDYLITLSDAEVKEAFPPQSVNPDTKKRIPVKEITGTISQTVLIKRLKENPNYNGIFGIKTNSSDPADDTPLADYDSIKNGFNSLPDGIYRVGISIRDYYDAKLIMPTDPKAADAVTVNVVNEVVPPQIIKYFWIAVDSKNPEIKIHYTTDKDPGPTRPSGGIISPKTPLEPNLAGFVYDENGPITLVDWRVTNIDRDPNLPGSKMGDTVPDGTPRIVTAPLVQYPYENGKWKYEFAYKMDMNGRNKGAYSFELTFQDRFGNRASVSLMYTVDNEPPKVSLTRPIETFSRPFDDVDLKDYVNVSGNINKERLAVKVVNFSINAVDNFKVAGVRWWLLPANTGSRALTGDTDKGAFDSTGIVAAYNSFPANALSKLPGIYYGSAIQPDGFSKGVYGVVDMENKKFTIAIDTEKLMSPANGEYRLHIIAEDDAGNYSTFVTPSIIADSHVFQEVFFLHEEDRPYFGTMDNITPGTVFDGDKWFDGTKWPADKNGKAVDMDVRGGNPIVRGTIFENNGFFADASQSAFRNGSITIWFSDTDADAAKPLPANWEDLVEKDLDIRSSINASYPNYTRKKIPDDLAVGLGRQGRNISLALELTTLFPNVFKEDGKKRYIIKATDSPVNKLWYEGGATPAGIQMGVGNAPAGYPAAEDDNVRVSRWRQFAFVYDAVPPKVIITKPDESGNKFGRNFADPGNGFNLAGSMFDMNLATMTFYYQNLPKDHKDYVAANYNEKGQYIGPPDDRYYFEYYLDSRATERTKFILDANTPGVTITKTPADNPTLVEFDIKPSAVVAGIISQATFDELSEGQHTLNVFAWDKSGKEGAAWVSFTKDTKPPSITFSNLDQKPYDDTNKSKVDKGWWTMSATARQEVILGTRTKAPIPLTTIYYEKGVGIPELRGSISDLVSNIALTVGTDSTVGSGDVNVSDSPFKYWIDNDPTTRYAALIDGVVEIEKVIGGVKQTVKTGGRSVRWTILLTDNGKKAGTILPDGIHTIKLTAADEAGEPIPDDECYTIAFRIDSKPPTSSVVPDPLISVGVYGNAAQQNPIMFKLKLTADDANLDRVELRLVRKDVIITGKENMGPQDVTEITKTFTARDSDTWTYTPGVTVPSAVASFKDDNVNFSGTYEVSRDLFTNVSDGKYEAVVAAYDTAGNKSEEFVYPFIYDKTGPVIEFTNPPDETQNAATLTLTPKDFINLTTLEGENKINRLTSENLRIQGNVKDSFSAVRQVQSQIWKWNWTTGAWEVLQSWADVWDYSTNTQTTVAWTKNLLGQNAGDLDLRTGLPANTAQTLGANLGDAEGLYRIQVRARDASTVASPGPAWNPATGANPGEGNPMISDYVYFYYDRTNPELSLDTISGVNSNATYFPKPAGGFTFEGTVKDNNRFAKLEVKFVTAKGQTIPPTSITLNNLATPNLNQGPDEQKWKAEFKDSSENSFPDGRYTVTVTVSDMTGRTNKTEVKFILDSTPPGARFTGPAKESKSKYFGYGDDSDDKKPTLADLDGFASVEVQGGVTSIITGETWDRPGTGGESGSESGLDKMWFRLGYIDGSTTFPDKNAIKADEDRLVGLIPAGAVTAQGEKESDFAYRSRQLDYLSEYTGTGAQGNSWFRLGGTEKPTHFKIDNPNIYDWRMEIPSSVEGLKAYCDPIMVKGRQYNSTNPATLRMVQAVPGQAGVYRLPLWIRLIDIAGNVAYYCHDIWIYPDGSIPSTTIENPSNGTRYNARGGTISVDGVAKSNTSVYDVIFRVFTDDVTDTNLDGIQTRVTTNGVSQDLPNPHPKTIGAKVPDVTSYLRINGYNLAETTTVNKLPAAYQNASAPWQKANLTMQGGAGEPVIPWSIMLNSEDQIKNRIEQYGFASGGGAKDMIRVWLEVFVFNGEGSPIRSSIYPDDLQNTGGGSLYGTAAAPKPYVKAFYIGTNSAAVTHPNVGTWKAGATGSPNLYSNFTWNVESPANQGRGGYEGAGKETRSYRFAFNATLDPNPSGASNSGLGEVAYRVKLDGGSYGGWTIAWKTGDAVPFNNGKGVSIAVRPTTADTNRPDNNQSPARTRYDFVYAIDSRNAGDSATFAEVPGKGNGWQYSGGTITVQVRIKDTASPPNEAEQSIQVSVDNFAPVADVNYKTNPKVAGSNVDFMGRVYDYATAPAAYAMNTEYTPRKLAGVSVWFTKEVKGATHYVNMNGVAGKPATTATLTGTRSISATTANSRTVTIPAGQGGVNDAVSSITLDNPGTTASITYPGLGGKAAHLADYVRDISGSTATPGTRMLWAPVNSADYDVRWSFTLDSNNLPDGDLTLHYIVVDAAGNASYYTQGPITVKNKYPEINRVTLYTVNSGISAAYTQPDKVEYNVNDYRSKMFANYTADTDKTRSNSTGYLNSGFISKNNYIGFEVETTKGNRPLSFRLQHVTRKRVPLTRANVQKLVDDRNSPNNINLYTIAWHGDYSSNNWKALGVHEDNPTLGTHFVLQPTLVDGKLPDDFKEGTTAEVWRYSIRVSKPDLRPTGAANEEDSTDTVVIGPDNFKFDGATDFTNISDYEGSHPDYGYGDLKPDKPASTLTDTDPLTPGIPDPSGTAFFLIRVWDAVGKPAPAVANPGTAAYETWVNDQLHDALVIGMNVYKTDKTPPLARLYDLNPYTEIAVTGNNLTEANKTATIRNAINPNAIGSNIVRGGLFNTNTERAMVRSGFIDPRGGSTVLNPKNGLYDTDGQLISGVELPDYPLKDPNDGTPAGTIPGAATDKVSGRVILRGLAWDDQLLYEIQIKVGSTTTPILRLDSTTATMKAVGTANAYAAETLNWKTGHTVEWAYVWDTGTGPGNQTVQVIAEDYKSSTSTPGTNRQTSSSVTVAQETADTTGKTFHNTVTVEVVPYITGFERATPMFTTKRSLQGWYSFYQGEQDVKVNGYNFGTSSATINLNGTSVGTVNNGTPADKQRIFNIPAGGTSGAITMTTSSIAAYNNTSTTAGKSWNKEVNTYTPGSDLWTNRHYAHIWQTNEQEGSGSTAGTIIAGTNSSSGMDTPAGKASPSMALQYAGDAIGRLHAVWSVYNLDTIAYGNNAGPSTGAGNLNGYIRVNRSGDPYSSTDMDYYNGGTPSGYINNVSIVALYQRDGGGRLILRPTVVENDLNGSDDNSLVVAAGPATVWGSTFSTDTERYQNPRIKKLAVSTANTNPGTVIISSFDSYDRRLFYTRQSGTLSNSSGATFGNSSLQFFLDGGGTVETGNNTRSEIGSVPIVAASVTNSNTYGTISRSNSAGQYSAIDYDSSNRPVIAYFDDQNQTLRLLYANSDNPTAGNAWTRRYVLNVGDPLRLGSGSYVSMKIDRAKSDTIHLAFYNSNNKAIVYASGTTTGAFTASVIDRVVEGGQWTDIAVDTSGNPWIVYADSSRTTNRDGVRIAYKSPATGAGAFTRTLTDPISGNAITGWEAMTMPANYKVNNDRLNIAAWPPTGYSGSATASPIGNWHAAVGYGSDKFRIGFFFKPTGSPTMANQP